MSRMTMYNLLQEYLSQLSEAFREVETAEGGDTSRATRFRSPDGEGGTKLRPRVTTSSGGVRRRVAMRFQYNHCNVWR